MTEYLLRKNQHTTHRPAMTILSNPKDAAPLEVSHGAHPEHTLRRQTTTVQAAAPAVDAHQFQCDGCKEPGAGDRYACRACDMDLHVECALAEPALAHHPLLKDAEFRLQELPRPGPGAGHDDNAGSGSGSGSGILLCVACGGDVLGWHYHCADNAGKKKKKKGYMGLYIHPCCAALPRAIRQEELTLELRKEAFHRCDSCRGWDRGGWFYRSTCKKLYLHVACVKGIMIAGAGAGATDPLAPVKEAALRIWRAKKDEEGEVERLVLGLILGG